MAANAQIVNYWTRVNGDIIFKYQKSRQEISWKTIFMSKIIKSFSVPLCVSLYVSTALPLFPPLLLCELHIKFFYSPSSTFHLPTLHLPLRLPSPCPQRTSWWNLLWVLARLRRLLPLVLLWGPRVWRPLIFAKSSTPDPPTTTLEHLFLCL